MLNNASPITFLKPGQIAYFYLLGREENIGGKITVNVTFIGSKSHKTLEVEREFQIVENKT